jgi:hypothetical protein
MVVVVVVVVVVVITGEAVGKLGRVWIAGEGRVAGGGQ